MVPGVLSRFDIKKIIYFIPSSKYCSLNYCIEIVRTHNELCSFVLMSSFISRLCVVSFPDPHTQQRMDYITATNAYQAGDETRLCATAR